MIHFKNEVAPHTLDGLPWQVNVVGIWLIVLAILVLLTGGRDAALGLPALISGALILLHTRSLQVDGGGNWEIVHRLRGFSKTISTARGVSADIENIVDLKPDGAGIFFGDRWGLPTVFLRKYRLWTIGSVLHQSYCGLLPIKTPPCTPEALEFAQAVAATWDVEVVVQSEPETANEPVREEGASTSWDWFSE